MELTALIKERLYNNPLRNISLLKMLSAYPDVMDVHHVEQGEQWGILMLLPSTAYSYDHRVYPEADFIVFMDYSSPIVLPALLELLPAQANLVFKLQEEEYRVALAEHFSLHKVRGFFSYSTSAGQFPPQDTETILNHSIDERLIPLWEANQYSIEEIIEYFQEGAFSVSVFQEGVAVSTCLSFRNTQQIWEIGAVHTVECARRQGLAQKVVRTAIFHTLEQGYIPRYHVLEDNYASIQLAESLGLKPVVKLEHWINYPQYPYLSK
ncbi:GNAT family N-acetyltransferase [Paenibacillus sp. 19GGS1-52]|uniref:GNAT family N-acetyltransferase n=1 Tax=Paenibacillus sp. 19GGS1-52 TaxID=2758563 RepID=UPI001EFC1DFB|nr:GNAT family N-acetyltransferase [Paenibacillus sp. 19GGS1-52]ULO04684.1 GNAT family N-acetyltransferase [Paenibacillus sp. 19GGS1-52]